MKLMKLLCAMTLFLSLTSCIEIIDDLSISGDGSGTFKYHINLSSSKIKINSILALDSLDGKKVPSIAEIQSRADKIVKQLKEQNGITNVVFDANYTDFIFKVTCDFNNLNQLQSAIVNVIKSESKEKEIPELQQKKSSLLEELSSLTTQYDRIAQIGQDVEALQERLDTLEFRWLELSD